MALEPGLPHHRVFTIGSSFAVPDETLVSAFLNPKDTTSGLPWDLFDGFSVAAGEIGPQRRSKIHLLPFVTQVTFVRSGRLEVRMREPEMDSPYTARLEPDQAVLTKPGTHRPSALASV